MYCHLGLGHGCLEAGKSRVLLERKDIWQWTSRDPGLEGTTKTASPSATYCLNWALSVDKPWVQGTDWVIV